MKKNNYYWIIILILIGLGLYFIFKPIIEPNDAITNDAITNDAISALTEIKGDLDVLNEKVEMALESSQPDSSYTDTTDDLDETEDTTDETEDTTDESEIIPSSTTYKPSVSEYSMNQPSIYKNPSADQGQGTYKFTFSINSTNFSNTLTIIIDSNNVVTSIITPDNDNVLAPTNSKWYDQSTIGKNDNKLQVFDKNKYTFGQSGKGGLAINRLGDIIDKTIINAMSGNYNLPTPGLFIRGVNSYFFNTDLNGNQNLNVYNGDIYVKIPQKYYTLTITKQ